jgi:hypothetical protein
MELKRNKGFRINLVEMARIWKKKTKLKRVIWGIKLRNNSRFNPIWVKLGRFKR